MDYTVALFIERIPGSVIRKVPIGGIEQQCLCIPIDPSIFFMAKSGKRFLQITLREKEDMTGTETHTVYFSYPDRKMLTKENTARWCGKCFMSQPYELNADKTVKTDFKGFGTICLDDIPEDAISTNPIGKRYLRIMVQPMAEKDRGDNDLMIAVDPRYGADKGRRESLQNGYDAPLVEVGRMKHYNPAEPQQDGTAEQNNDRTIDGYNF